MSGTHTLEDALREYGNPENCPSCVYVANYFAMKTHLEAHYYPWIHDKHPWFTDHGQRHIESVKHAVDRLLFDDSARRLSFLDIYLLLVSVIWHDVGMLSERSNHSIEAQKYINKVKEFCFANQAIERIVSQIVRAHSGKQGWSFLNTSEIISSCAKKTYEVYPRSLAALLRFADEVSENCTRITTTLIDQVPPENQIYWYYAKSIVGSLPEPKRQRHTLAIELEKSDATRTFNCPEEYHHRADSEGNITLIQYIICRIEKMNNERAHCYPHMNLLADIQKISVRLLIKDGDTQVINETFDFGDKGLSTDTYPNIDLYTEMLRKCTFLSPSSMGGGA